MKPWGNERQKVTAGEMTNGSAVGLQNPGLVYVTVSQHRTVSSFSTRPSGWWKILKVMHWSFKSQVNVSQWLEEISLTQHLSTCIDVWENYATFKSGIRHLWCVVTFLRWQHGLINVWCKKMVQDDKLLMFITTLTDSKTWCVLEKKWSKGAPKQLWASNVKFPLDTDIIDLRFDMTGRPGGGG